MKEKIYLYTDGSCLNNQEKVNSGGFAYVLNYKNNIKYGYEYHYNTTNNRMELLAVINGLRQIKQNNFELLIFSDSAYIINAFNLGWINSWKKDNFIGRKNSDLWKELLILLENQSSYKFVKVKAHIETDYEISKSYEKVKNLVSFTEYKQAVKFNDVCDNIANRNLLDDESIKKYIGLNYNFV